MKSQRKLQYKVRLSLVYAAIMLIVSTIFANAEYSQSLFMPPIAILFAPFFLRQ